MNWADLRGSLRPLTLGLFFGLLLTSSVALAGAPPLGSRVEVTTYDGNVLQGTLVDRVLGGVVIEVAGGRVEIAYERIEKLTALDAPAGQHPHPSQPRDAMDELDERTPQMAPMEELAPAQAPRRSAPMVEPAPRAAPPRAVEPAPQPAPRRAKARSQRRSRPARIPQVSQSPDSDRIDFRSPPPKPRQSGTGLLVAGLVMIPNGLALGGLGLAAYEDRCGGGYRYGYRTCTEDDVHKVLLTAGGVLTAAGLVMTITGLVKRAKSGRAIRRWEKTYGEAKSEPLDLRIAPTFREDGGGLSLDWRF